MTQSAKQAAIWLAVSIFTFSASANIAAADQKSPFWGNLIQGPYSVGFETIETLDKSRITREKLDYDGVPFDGERSRRIQICIWYPAESSPDNGAMVYSEYVFPSPVDGSFYDYLAALQGREVFLLQGIYGNDLGRVRDILNLPVIGRRDAPRASGSFPLIIYHAHSGTGISENSVLCEYLASHGFIVATSHSVGTGQLTPLLNPVDIETAIRDRELIFGHMQDYPNVDSERIGLVGNSFGTLTSLLTQMRNYDIDAVLAIDPIFIRGGRGQLLTDNVGYDPARVQVPVMMIYADTQDSTLDLSVMDTLLYSQRYSLPLDGATRMDVSVYGLMPILLPDSTTAGRDVSASPYYDICRTAHDFLATYVAHDYDRLASLDAAVSSRGGTVIEAQKAPPTEIQFGRMIQQGRISAAMGIFEQLRAADSTRIYFQEANINVLGYQLLGQNRVEDAKQVLWLNTVVFPRSANSWDSYADACIAAGDTEDVVRCYEKVLEVLPTDTLLPANFREILLNNATQGLEQYKQGTESH